MCVLLASCLTSVSFKTPKGVIFLKQSASIWLYIICCLWDTFLPFWSSHQVNAVIHRCLFRFFDVSSLLSYTLIKKSNVQCSSYRLARVACYRELDFLFIEVQSNSTIFFYKCKSKSFGIYHLIPISFPAVFSGCP